MDNEIVVMCIANFLTSFEILKTYRNLNTLSRSLWRNLVADRGCPDGDVFDVFKATTSRTDWLNFLIPYSLSVTSYSTAINGDTIVHKCARKGDLYSVFILMSIGTSTFDPNMRGSGGMTVLHCAAASSHKSPKLCKFLITKSFDVTIRDDIGRLAEDWANKQHAFDVAEILRNRRLPPPTVGCFNFP
jgi:ankyrin repeat protein